jgi:CHASE2 domain-containing sensor protein
MKAHTVYRTFQTAERREFVRITEDVEAAVAASDGPDDRVGYVNFWPDEDGVVRRARFRITLEEAARQQSSTGAEVYESLAARMMRKAGLADFKAVVVGASDSSLAQASGTRQPRTEHTVVSHRS